MWNFEHQFEFSYKRSSELTIAMSSCQPPILGFSRHSHGQTPPFALLPGVWRQQTALLRWVLLYMEWVVTNYLWVCSGEMQ